MTNKTFSRRNFVKLAALSLGALAFNPLSRQHETPPISKAHKVFRVGSDDPVSVFAEPTDESTILYRRYKDDLVNVYDVVESDTEPKWYRVWGGYMFGRSLVEVKYKLNAVADAVRSEGQLGEITVPYTRTYRYTRYNGWERIYRLYYGSNHWIKGIIGGPDGKAWYQLEEAWSKIQYAIPAEHMRLVKDSEFEQIHPDVPPQAKRIEISLYRQELTAYEYDEPVLTTRISSGTNNFERITPVGEFYIGSKMPAQHMGDGNVTDDIYAYELIGVPWCSYFVLDKGIATHGTYWHNNFGIPMSHGCVNMRSEEAKWIFRWSNPVSSPYEREGRGNGTRVTVT